MTKREIVKKIAESLGLSKRMAEYYTSFILDLIILEAERTGRVKIDQHVFYKRTISARRWKDKLTGLDRITPMIHLVSYRNTRRYKKGGRNEETVIRKNNSTFEEI